MKIIVSTLATVLLFSTTASSTEYNIDPAHSEVSFKVKHLGLTNVRGNFLDFTGTIEFNKDDVKASNTIANIKVQSVNTANQKRDDHLRSPDFFNAGELPLISFKSKKISNINGNNFDVLGELTIREVTKPVTLAVEHTGQAIDPYGNQRVGFSATTKINRKDFGMTWNKILETGSLVVGEEVQIEIAIEAIKVK